MARRSEFQGICNDLTNAFVSRNNELDGYWALGKMQGELQRQPHKELRIELISEIEVNQNPTFSAIVARYRDVLLQALKSKNIPASWMWSCSIVVQSSSSNELCCECRIETDLGREYHSRLHMQVFPHDPERERRSLVSNEPQKQI